MKEKQLTTSMSSVEICKETIGCLPGHIRGRGASKKLPRSFYEDQYISEIEENKRKREEAEQQVAEMKEEIKLLQEEQRKTNDLLKTILEQMGRTEE